MGKRQAHTGFWWGKLRKRDHLEELGVDESTILKRIDLAQDTDVLD
jgi:hypothetical protein